MNTECWRAVEFSRRRLAKTDHFVSLSNPARATTTRLEVGRDKITLSCCCWCGGGERWRVDARLRVGEASGG